MQYRRHAKLTQLTSFVVLGVKTTWKGIWLTLMRELAPQSETGAFLRSSYAFHHDIGTDPNFPARPCYELGFEATGNPRLKLDGTTSTSAMHVPGVIECCWH